ncbi:hypothetical protein FRACYDRAFT_185711 [Fragilariopsis cylindrus CCMP1102]|uniref:Uncharacterized protein n=1 Tax=Fragilariopsis cylindrus CCMP1102 TaxID=635003 RepID=A0A1E7FEH2_9STRA|nr:hypothetical protein FRACYDRAFT_185711 [Fragilariopsis cylindrus CCMP1102]|eukprot:OEU16560.1 hypothetical protein FRACYDRAFT_185711 [Fragilariopsis cylindrus CCMP1102]
MTGVDEETALVSPNSPLDNNSLLDDERGKSISNHSNSNTQHQQQLQANHIPATRGSIRLSDAQSNNNKKIIPPKLLHPVLHNVPMHFRFGLNGFLSNVLFMVAYNAAVVQFEHTVSSSTIYATVYLIFIPVSHAIISLLVFGWPERYIRSLMSNAPVGLTAIVLGAGLTAYLDKIEFNGWVAEAMVEYWRILGYKVESSTAEGGNPEDASISSSGGEFYSSIFVLLVTGIWTFVLSVMVNSPAESLEKKEL